MSTAKGHLNRRDFLSHGVRAGVGLAAASSGLALRSAPRVSAAQTTLNYISVSNIPGVKEAMISQFEHAHPGVKVSISYGPATEDQYHDKMVTLLAAKDSSIDVFDTDVIWPPEMALPGWLAPLDAYLSPALRKKYSPSMIDAQTFNGHLVGIPYYMDSGHLIYRKDLLDAHGFQAPKTWLELAQQAQVITKANKGLYGYVADWSKNEQLSDNFFEFIWSNGGDVLDHNGKVVINSPQNVEAVQMMRDFIAKYQIMAPGVLSIGLEPGRTLFTEGHAVFHRNWGYAYALSENASQGSKIVEKPTSPRCRDSIPDQGPGVRAAGAIQSTRSAKTSSLPASSPNSWAVRPWKPTRRSMVRIPRRTSPVISTLKSRPSTRRIPSMCPHTPVLAHGRRPLSTTRSAP